MSKNFFATLTGGCLGLVCPNPACPNSACPDPSCQTPAARPDTLPLFTAV